MEPEGTMPVQSQVQPHPAAKKIIVVVAFLIAGALLFGGYFGIPMLLGKKDGVQTKPPGGLEIMSFITLPLDMDKDRILTFSYNAEKEYFPLPPADPQGTIEYQFRFSSNGWGTFLRATNLTGVFDDLSTVPFEVYRTDLHGVRWSQLQSAFDQADKITNDPTTLKQAPAVSMTGGVAYMSQPIGQVQNGTAEDWNIHYVSLDNTDEVVAKGTYPQWMNKDTLVFLKNDGVYMYSLETKEESLMWAMIGDLTSDVTMDVSNDGSRIVVSSPVSNKVDVFTVKDEASGEIMLEGVLPLTGFFPIISFDNQFLAMYTPENKGGVMVPKISYANLDTLELLPSATLNLEGWNKSLTERQGLSTDKENPDLVILSDWLTAVRVPTPPVK